MKFNFVKIVAAILLVFATTACEDDFQSPASVSGESLFTLLDTNSEFDLLSAALDKTGLKATLSNLNSGDFTIFAPKDSAFFEYMKVVYAATPPADEAAALTLIAGLTNTSTPLNLGTLTTRINYHLVSSEIKASAITGGQTFTTINNARLSVSKVGAVVSINANVGTSGGRVQMADVADASNGVVHQINKVLNPISANNVLNPFGMSINYALAPPLLTGGLETAADVNAADFDLLAYGLRKSGLAFTLVPNATPLPDWTVFAPNDGALLAYLTSVDPTVTTEALAVAYMKNTLSSEALTSLLKYHVIGKRVLSTDLSNGQSIATAAGTNVGVSISAPDVFITDNNAAADPKVIATNNILSNGVVHTINAVLRSN